MARFRPDHKIPGLKRLDSFLLTPLPLTAVFEVGCVDALEADQDLFAFHPEPGHFTIHHLDQGRRGVGAGALDRGNFSRVKQE